MMQNHLSEDDGRLAGVQVQAEAAAQCAAAAAGLMRAMARPLGSVQYWREYHGSAAPAFLTLLSLIIPQQPALNPQVPPCLTTLFMLSQTRPEGRRHYC